MTHAQSTNQSLDIIIITCFYGMLVVCFLSVWFESVLGPLELHLEPLGAHLEAVHGLDGGERAHRVVVRHEPWKRDHALITDKISLEHQT